MTKSRHAAHNDKRAIFCLAVQISLVLLFIGGGASRAQNTGESSTSRALSVMTFNIRYDNPQDGPDRWYERKPRTMQVLARLKPDVIGLQEALLNQVDDLLTSFPSYSALGVGRDDGRCAGEYSAIFYDTTRLQALRSDTFWLSETPEIPASNQWGMGCVRICTWAHFKDLKTGKFFYLYNTHLDHKSQPGREKSAALILDRIRKRAPKDPVLLTGDFNTSESNPVSTTIRAAGYRDTFRVIHPDATEVGTTNAFKETTEPNKIDYVYVDDDWEVHQADIVRDKVDGRWISDHLPVTAAVALR
ncbi:MAG: endonuclease/exonuclease/phosphatase family protein [Candidatus Sumerlaeaceae bacterium]